MFAWGITISFNYFLAKVEFKAKHSNVQKKMDF